MEDLALSSPVERKMKNVHVVSVGRPARIVVDYSQDGRCGIAMWYGT
jgi:hypothetical protein